MKVSKVTDEAKAIIKALYGAYGEVAPRAIVEAARHVDSPLHPYFDWDDASAADKHRLDQARVLMRRVLLVVEESDPVTLNVSISNVDPANVPEYIVIDPRRGGYVATIDVANDPENRAKMFAVYKRDMTGWLGRLKKFQAVLHSQNVTGADVESFDNAINAFESAIGFMPDDDSKDEAAD